MQKYTFNQLNIPLYPFLREREVWIYLPVHYQTSSDKRYPVVYMHDGQNLTNHRKIGSTNKWNLESWLVTNDSFIIVAIDCVPEHRLNEYAPFPIEPSARDKVDQASFNHALLRSEGAAYIEWLVQELKPWIDQHYHSDAQRNGIVGSSMGGLISLFAQLKYPELFTWSGVVSPAYWFAPEQVREYISKSSLTKDNTIYTSVGTQESGLANAQDYLEEFVLVNAVLKERTPAQLHAHIIEGGEHNERDWAQLVQAMFDTFEIGT